MVLSFGHLAKPHCATLPCSQSRLSCVPLRLRLTRTPQPLQNAFAVDYRIAAPPARIDQSGTADQVRVYLTKLGWDKAWIDGITDRIVKMEFQTSIERVEDVVKKLEGLGIPTHWVCNMAARVPAFLGKDPKSELQPVLDYLQKQGLKGTMCLSAAAGEALAMFLRDYPRLLLFSPSHDGRSLKFNQAYAAVNVVKDEREQEVAKVSYWREGAAFETAPVAPLKPNSL